MKLTQLLVSGAQRLLRADFRHPIEWLVRRRSDRVNHTFRLFRTPSTPSWTKHEGELTLARTEGLDCSNRYSSVVQCRTGTAAWTVEPPEQFTSLDFDLIDPGHVDRITATVTFETADGIVSMDATYSPPMGQGRDIVPFEFESPAPAIKADLVINFGVRNEPYDSSLTKLVQQLPVKTGQRLKTEPEPWVSVPATNGDRDELPHVFLVSIDSLRYDYLDALTPLLSVLGDEAVVPDEPRVQGIATQQSHGSILTGTHPSIHGLAHDTIDAGLPTIAELLAETQYRCSACVSSGNLSPGFGFGRGFHRYEHQEMDWERRRFDAKTIVDTAIEWLETDLENDHRVFQFLHIFDAHYPYTPAPPVSPEKDIDFELAERTLKLAADLQDTQMDPLDIEETPLAAGDVERWKRNYRRSLRYVTTQLVRLVNTLENYNILDKSLILVTGDHGEEFFENGFVFHNSLHDENIRPGMIIKPPEDAGFEVPDHPDTIDFLPTIARLVDADVPPTCAGRAWQSTDRDTTRLIERLIPSAYQIAVEYDDEKAILTYPSNHPETPTRAQIEEGPASVEYYKLAGLPPRERRIEIPTATDEEQFLDTAINHLMASTRDRIDNAKTVSDSVERRLSELGYK